MSMNLTDASWGMHRDSNFAVSIRTYVSVLTILLTSILLAGFLSGCMAPVGSSSTALSGHLLVVGSTALQPLASAAAMRFQQQHPGTHIEVQGGGSVTGLKAVTGKQADIGTSDIYADPAS